MSNSSVSDDIRSFCYKRVYRSACSEEIHPYSGKTTRTAQGNIFKDRLEGSLACPEVIRESVNAATNMGATP